MSTMLVKDSRSKKILDKVFDHLESIDVTKLTMDELKDFLEVVQKGQFLETTGAFAGYPYGFGGANPFSSVTNQFVPTPSTTEDNGSDVE